MVGTFHKVSPKYLPLCVAEFITRFARSRLGDLYVAFFDIAEGPNFVALDALGADVLHGLIVESLASMIERLIGIKHYFQYQ